MSDINDGGPAFPIATTSTPWPEGISLRDWFAGQALPACIVECSSHELLPSGDTPSLFARRAYEVADAMIKRSRTDG